MLGRKTLEEKIAATVWAEFEETVTALERDRREYLRRLKLKEKSRGVLQEAEAQVQRLSSERSVLRERASQDARSEEGEAGLSEIEPRSKVLERATKQAKKVLGQARADFQKADFDEVAEGFALKAKAAIVEDEVDRRVRMLEATLEDLLAGVREEVKVAAQALREEYEEFRFVPSRSRTGTNKG